MIDDSAIAGEKAFNWHKEFPQVFKEKQKKPFHITWVTHNSRISQRMIDNKVKLGEAYWLENDQEVEVAKTIKTIVEQDELNVMAFNSCGDHIHLLLVCEEEEIPNIVRKLKGKSSQKLKEYLQIPKEEQFTLWAQKYSTTYIDSEQQLWNTVEYIKNNRQKHGLEDGNKGQLPLATDSNKVSSASNKGLQPLVAVTTSSSLTQPYAHAFRTEYKGGFDVVIGNPPYGAKINTETQNYLNKKYIKGGSETAISFIKLVYDTLLKSKGEFGFIIPKSFTFSSNYESIRNFILDDISEIIDCKKVWKEVLLEQIIFFFKKKNKVENYKSGILDGQEIKVVGEINKSTFEEFGFYLNGISEIELNIGKKSIQAKNTLKTLPKIQEVAFFKIKFLMLEI